TIVDSIRKLTVKGLIQRSQALATFVQIQRFDAKGYPQEIKDLIARICKEFQGEGYGSLLERYVGLGLLEDELDDDGEITKDSDKRIADLAQYAIDHPEELTVHLKWLVTGKAKNGYSFGNLLAHRDPKRQLWDPIKEA